MHGGRHCLAYMLDIESINIAMMTSRITRAGYGIFFVKSFETP